MRLVALYPGSFDPVTNGHLDVITRAARFADHLIVAVLNNSSKHPLFTVDERMAMIRQSTGHVASVEVTSFGGLLVDFATQRDANVIVRGIRAISDYEAELQMAAINRRLRPQLETVFLLGSEEYAFISSRIVKEIISHGGDVSQFVPAAVTDYLRARK